MRSFLGFGCVLVLGTAFVGWNMLYEGGIAGQTMKSLRAPYFVAKGCFCHGDTATPNVRVWIDGPESLAAGGQALYTINVAKDSNIEGGFNVAAFLGQLGVYDSVWTQLMWPNVNNPIDSMELVHTDARESDGHDTISWSFWYRAPRIADIIDTLYAVGNSVDTNLAPDFNDKWNYAPNFLVRVTRPADVAQQQSVPSFRLFQNYPNPFNPSTTICYELPAASHVSLTVYNISGQRVATLVDGHQNAATYRQVWNAEGMVSGVYFCRLEAGKYTATRELLLLR